MNSINFLCAADLHLGRQVGSPSERSYVIKAWENLIEACLTKTPQIDALLLAGDVIDGDDLFIEMYGVLKKGIRRLLEHNIQVIAIAGNHDPELLEQLRCSMELPGFHLIGREGKWERLSCVFRGRVIHIDGISFTSPFMESNPLEAYDLEKVYEGEPLIGLLHCDVDVSKSRYAPVRSTDFLRMPHQAWILGHIHIPAQVGNQPSVRYCGSLQGLDVSEVGSRGALLVTIHLNGSVEIRERPLAPLRWERVSIDLSKFPSADWMGGIFEAIESELLMRIQGQEKNLEMIGLRLILEGRTPFFREVRRSLSRLQDQETAGLSVNGKWIPYFIESIHNETRPSYDLKKLSEGNDFLAALARELMAFQGEEMGEYMEGQFRKEPALKQAEEAWLGEGECRELYLSKGFELLDELLRQKQETL